MKRKVFLAAMLWTPFAMAADIVPLTYDAATADKPASVMPGACAINLLSVADQRTNKETIGWRFTVPQSGAGDTMSWLNAGLDHLQDYGFQVAHNTAPMSGAVNVNVRLIRAYTWPANVRINGTVAMDVGVIMQDGTEELFKVRANGSKGNIMGADSEHVTALNYAANNAYSALADSLKGFCGRKI